MGLDTTREIAVVKEEVGRGKRRGYVPPVVWGDGVVGYSKGRMNWDLEGGEVKMLDDWLPEGSKYITR